MNWLWFIVIAVTWIVIGLTWWSILHTRRTIRSIREINANMPVSIPMPHLFTRSPEKWQVLDTETGQVWMWANDGWYLAGAAVRRQASEN